MRFGPGLALAASFATALPACAPGGDDGGAYFGSTRRIGKALDTFYVNSGGEPEYLDPGKINDTLSSGLALQLFEGLTKYHPVDNHLIQGAAVSWDQSEDNRLFRFHLRPEARWSDGKPVTAHDFEYAWKRVLRPSTASRSAPSLYPLKNGELFNRGMLKVARADARVLAEPRAGAAEVAKIAGGFAVRILARSPQTVATGVAPLAEVPAVTTVSRKKADPKTGAGEQLEVGRKPIAADATAGWNGQVVRVIRAGAAVECDGEVDRWYLVARDGGQGWLPGCLLKPAKAEQSYALVARHDARPTFAVAATPPPEADTGLPEPLGFVDTATLGEDDALLGVRAADDLTLDVELERPTPYFLDLTAHATLYPVRRDVIEEFEKRHEPDLWTRPGTLISNGPYALASAKFRYEIVMDANPHYWAKDKLKIHKIVWIEVEQYHPTLNLYKAGDIDHIGDNLAIPAEYMPIVEKKKDFLRNDYLSVYWYELNTTRPPLDDVRVRRALNLAVDKKQLIASISRGGQTPATHYVPDFTGLGYSTEAAADKASGADPFAGPEREFNPARARELLGEAGYPVQEDGGVFRAEGMPSIDILYNTSEGHKAIAVAVQDMWKKHLGISIALRNEEWRVMLKSYRDGNFHVMRFGQVADYNHANTFLETFGAGHPQNKTGWSSPAFDETMRRAAREPDTKKSIRLYREAERIALDAVPRVPIYFYTRSNLIKPYVRGFWGSARNVHHIEFLWIDPDFENGAPNTPAYTPLEMPPPGRIAPPAAVEADPVTRYLIKRLLGIVPMLLLIATVVFVVTRIAPGGPFDSERQVPAEIKAALDAKYHLDNPVWKQYLDWLSGVVLRGDLGPCFKYPNRTVNEIIAVSLPVSMQLGVLALLFALAVGVPLGIVGATRQNTAADTLAMAIAMTGVSIPRFVLAPLLVLLFSLKLFVLPVARWETWRHMILPVFCAGLPMAAYIARLTRAGMLEVVRSDFVRTARAKGLSERAVIWRHAVKGGLLPVVSYIGPGFSGLLVGSLVVESIFDIPGMGRYFVEAARNADYNLMVGVTLVYGVILMVSNAAVDVAYALLDPRVELDRGK